VEPTVRHRLGQSLAVIGRLAIAVAALALIVVVACKSRRELPRHETAATPIAFAGGTRLPLDADDFLPLVCQPLLGELQFVDPVQTASLPDGSGRLLVAERTGRIQLVDPRSDPPRETTFLDLTSRVFMTPYRAEEGILSLALHPQFAVADSPHRGELFVYYTGKSGERRTNRLSRFRLAPCRQTVDLTSEEVLIDQLDAHDAHNGGSLAFGPDGCLYLSLGDDANQKLNAQTISRNLFSGILRLDVDCRGSSFSHPPPRQPESGCTAGYYIPHDNPFVGKRGVLEEFFAMGLRNPWRMSFDRLTGRLYVGDVGERKREEISVVDSGSNLGWPYAEGMLVAADSDPQADVRPSPYLGREAWPIHDYPRDWAHRCVIGGHIYRGRQFPELAGKYIFADQSGRIFALQLAANGRQVLGKVVLAVVPNLVMGISSLDVDERGEILISTIGTMVTKTGRIFRLSRSTAEQHSLPPTLAQTGLFDDWRRLVPRPHLVSYDVNVPLWSDGAEKLRWIALPPGQEVECTSDGKFRFPGGTVFVKHFALATDERQPQCVRPLETRLLVVEPGGAVHGASYRWSADGKRTRRLTFGESETIDVVQADGSVRQQVWQYPGRFDCLMCHNDVSGYVLGFTPKQLAGEGSGFRVQGSGERGGVSPPVAQEPGDREQETVNELARLIACGVIRDSGHGAALANVSPLVPLNDERATLAVRVRSYLDVNCSVCHNPGRYFSAFDARFERHPNEQGIIEGPSYFHGEFGGAMRIVKPGSVQLSVAHMRISSRDPHLRMPPLGSTVVDAQAQRVLAEWIKSLAPAAEVASRPDDAPQ
jgi:glucose/arabinose dehydrogenase